MKILLRFLLVSSAALLFMFEAYFFLGGDRDPTQVERL